MTRRRLTAFSLGLAAGRLMHAQQRSRNRLETEEEYLDAMNKGLDLVRSKIPQNAGDSKLIFSANLVHAHGAFIPFFDKDVLIRYVDGLKQLGVQRIDINPGLKAWVSQDRSVIDKYEAVVSHIRSSGLQLAINPEFNRKDLERTDFESYKNAVVKVYPELARRYKPDIFSVLHEPTTMAGRLGIKISPEQSAAFIKETLAVVKRESSSSRIAAGLHALEGNHVKGWLQIPELQLIGLDIYDLRMLPAFNKIIQAARQAGKGVYIEETWRFPFQPPGESGNLEKMSARSIGDGKYAALDAKWLETMTQYARAWKLEAITPFWTQTFFHYSSGGADGLGQQYNEQTASAIKSGRKTDTAQRYRALVQQSR